MTKDFFEEHGDVFQTISEHYKKYKTVPEKETIQKVFPNLHFYDGAEPLKFFVDAIKEQHKKKLLKSALPKVIELLPTDVDAAEKELQRLVTTTKSIIKVGSTFDARNSAETMIRAYERRESNLGVDGYSTSWPYLDALTCGYHNGELIIWMGKSKMGKSWVAIWSFHHIWNVHEVPCLFITKEMGTLAIRQRFDAIDNRLSLDEIRRGQMSAEQKEKYYNRLREIDKKVESGRMAPFGIHGFDLTDGSSGVSSLIPYVEEYLSSGGVLFVDGLYLIPDDRGESDWRGIVNVAMDLKILAQTYDIPVIVTTQQSLDDKSDKPRLENAAYGKYIVQYGDLILAIGRSDIERLANRATVYVLGQREGDIGEFSINMKFNPIDFTQCYDKTVDDDDDGDEIFTF